MALGPPRHLFKVLGFGLAVTLTGALGWDQSRVADGPFSYCPEDAVSVRVGDVGHRLFVRPVLAGIVGKPGVEVLDGERNWFPGRYVSGIPLEEARWYAIGPNGELTPTEGPQSCETITDGSHPRPDVYYLRPGEEVPLTVPSKLGGAALQS